MASRNQELLERMRAEGVERAQQVRASVKAAFESLAAQIAELKDDPEELQALADQLKSGNDELTALVVANTPAAPEPAPPPTPPQG